VGELEEGKYKFKSLKFTFTSVEPNSGLKVGDTATVTNGGFEFLDQKTDQNKDGMNDKTGEALPLGFFGNWGMLNKSHKIAKWVPEAKKLEDASLEQKVLAALPEALAKIDRAGISEEVLKRNLPILLEACKNSGITDPAEIAYVLITAGHESNFGDRMYEYPWGKPPNVQEDEFFNRKYDGMYGNGSISSGDGYRYRGRGYSMLTFKANYQTATKLCQQKNFKINDSHPDLVNNPDLVAENRLLSAFITTEGMKLGLFTGLGFNDKDDDRIRKGGEFNFNGARGIIGTDKSGKIAEGGKHLYQQMTQSSLQEDQPKIGNYRFRTNSGSLVELPKGNFDEQGAWPTTTDRKKISWQETSVVNSKTANALADVRDTTANEVTGKRVPYTASEFLALGRDYSSSKQPLGMTAGGIFQVHTGWDLNVVGDNQLNKPTFAAADGIVYFVGDLSVFRKIVVIYHPQLNRWTRYAHLERDVVREGEFVKAGQRIGDIGNANGEQPPHLHFDIVKKMDNVGMWNGRRRDQDGDNDYDIDDRIEYVKEHFEDPIAFFAKTSVSIPREK
jgi:murein DD-endopeptidase MepM/ murein hydrolase activator NlpD/predicted chitinase